MVYTHTKGVVVPITQRWRKRLIFGMTAVFVAGLSAFSLSANAETAQVKNVSTGESFKTIQAAIDAETTAEGNIIEVPDGTYAPFVVDKDANITVRAAADAKPMIKGKMNARTNAIIDVQANGATIQGLTVALPERDGRDKDWSKHKAPEFSRDKNEATTMTDTTDKRVPSRDAVLVPATAVHGMIGVSISGQDVTVEGNTIKGKLLAIRTTSAHLEGNATIEDNKINAYIGLGFQNTNNTVRHNEVKTSLVGIASIVPGNTIEFNNFVSVSGLSALAFSGVELNVAKNWWGSDMGIGRTLFDNVVAEPWLCQPFQDGETLSVDGNCMPTGEPEVPPTEPVDTFAPAVVLTAPTEHAVLSGTVTFAGTVTDEANASHYFGVRDLSTEDATIVRKSDKMSATEPEVAASYEFDTSSLRDGNYRVILIGDDVAGNSGRVGANVVFENFVNNKDECLSGGWERGTFEGKTFASEEACVDYYDPAIEQPQQPQLPDKIRGWLGTLKDKLSDWNAWGWGWIDVSRGALNAFLGLRW